VAVKAKQCAPGCMPFGKYAGVKIEKLPFGYLDYLVNKSDLKSQPDKRELFALIENAYMDYMAQYKREPGSITLDFGKYNGSRLDCVPKEYIEWLLDQDWYMDNPLYEIVQGYSNEMDGRHR